MLIFLFKYNIIQRQEATMIQEIIYNILKKKRDKMERELIRMKWEKQKYESAVKKLKEIEQQKNLNVDS